MKTFVMSAAIAALILCAVPAQATTKTPPPKPAPAPAVSSSYSNSISDADSASNSGASVNSNSRNSLWVFPSPVFTAPLPISGCPLANVEQVSGAIGWSFVSGAKSSLNTDHCTAIMMHNHFIETCQYASAQQVRNLLTQKVLPGFKPTEVVYMDLTQEQCQALKAPPPLPAPVVYNLIDNNATKVVPAATCVTPPAPAASTAKKPAKSTVVSKPSKTC